VQGWRSGRCNTYYVYGVDGNVASERKNSQNSWVQTYIRLGRQLVYRHLVAILIKLFKDVSTRPSDEELMKLFPSRFN